MRCPYCSNPDLKVTDKRESEDNTNRRRRECLKCGKRFTTYEHIQLGELLIVKKDGRRETFSREKILRGLVKACEKRPISRDVLEKIVDEIETELLNGDSMEIKSDVIGNMIMQSLKDLDEIAYIRFASVYREFKDIKELEKELKHLKSS